MDLKRALENEESEEEDLLAQQTKRRKAVVNSVREAMGARYMQMNLPKIEPFLRKVIQEEVQNALVRHAQQIQRNPLQIKAVSHSPSQIRQRYRLSFQTEFPQTLFTNSPIKSQNNNPIQIALIDSLQNRIVSSPNPLSCSKIELLVLDGDFERNSWSETEFNENVVREREGKRPLLAGEVEMRLTSGVGVFADVAFTDNSSWRRNRRFRLGARVCFGTGTGTEERVLEGISSSFVVKDHRGESYKKHHPPALLDDVWRLEKIGKDGVFHKRLSDSQINSVEDFLRRLVIDPDGLRSLLGSGMSNKMWEATIEHAKECNLDYEKFYSYCDAQNQVVLLLNSIYQPVGSIFGNNYCSLTNLTPSQKAIIERLKQECYKFPERIIELSQQQAKDVRLEANISHNLLLPFHDKSTIDISSLHPVHHGPELESIDDLSQIAGIIIPKQVPSTDPLQFSSFNTSTGDDFGGLMRGENMNSNTNMMRFYCSEMDNSSLLGCL
ncbi:hypothetical protein LUZ60_013877 [Juncus effusus]|nr:hypothetical protein LUZ60_013877 [Juncus effusus]